MREIVELQFVEFGERGRSCVGDEVKKRSNFVNGRVGAILLFESDVISMQFLGGK